LIGVDKLNFLKKSESVVVVFIFTPYGLILSFKIIIKVVKRAG